MGFVHHHLAKLGSGSNWIFISMLHIILSILGLHKGPPLIMGLVCRIGTLSVNNGHLSVNALLGAHAHYV
jgi:hypothetical protein